MAGQLASLPLSIQLNDNARPYDGALLYLYDAGTSTPAVFYEDFATTIVLSWPLVADASGRIPMFWVADGSYRVRLTDNAGNEIFDINSITAVGPSAGSTGGGTSVSSDQLFQTGDLLWIPRDATRSGWVRGNALTIGSSSSGATERANADCQALFEYLWNNFNDGLCPVTTGRGSSALNDWNANKRIATFDMRGRCAHGLDTMGNSAALVLTGATTVQRGGSATSSALIAHNHGSGTLTGVVASHNHGPGTLNVGTSITNGTSVTRNFSSTTRSDLQASAAQTAVESVSAASATLSLASGAVTGVTGTASPALSVTAGNTADSGSGSFFSIMEPYAIGTWYIKL